MTHDAGYTNNERKNEGIQIDSDSDKEAPVAFKTGAGDNGDDFRKQDRNETKDGKQMKPNKSEKAIRPRRVIGDPGANLSFLALCSGVITLFRTHDGH